MKIKKKQYHKNNISDDEETINDNENRIEATEKEGVSIKASDDALDFFGKLKQQESEKEPIGTTHATGKKGDAVSGQGIMAGVRTSTLRPTGMGGGAIPHDQIAGDGGEWACLKCGKKNPKVSGNCSNCSALRRMNMYN
mmetsp:Transcript_14213/g.18487  ORF Transcript_14213/g.18487 Transcript_14213/m.18487 type:complete len:139 (-) Transcript_14213:34-450(-)